ncbi:thiolase family protein [Streptomyces specialis]|uniref:thiolase family protein n=1 Tax=Streptomyces specialis TaxID=498367 RepID=UPI00073E5FD8|nr:thiolase family protein [Streptomyces specialis]
MKGTSVAGVGSVGFGRHDESAGSLAGRALSAALADAGLRRDQIDGLVVQIGSPRGIDYDEAATLLGLDVRYASQTWSHGRFASTVLMTAAMAVECGLADYVACLGVFRNSPLPPYGEAGRADFAEGMREGGGAHAETPYAGLAAPIGGAALATRRYLALYGVDRDKLGAVAIAQRGHAALNEAALKRDPMTEADYRASRWIVEPLRLFDCSVPSDCGTVMIVTSAERARDLAGTPVRMLAYQGINAGPDEFIFGRPGLGINQADVFDYRPGTARVHAELAIAPADIGTFGCYDGFTSQVWWALERFGFCEPGDAPDWTQDGRIALGGDLPVNTSGGHLSEGHSNGWGQLAEIVTQVRGRAGARQVPGLRLAQWGSTLGDSIVFGRDE